MEPAADTSREGSATDSKEIIQEEPACEGGPLENTAAERDSAEQNSAAVVIHAEVAQQTEEAAPLSVLMESHRAGTLGATAFVKSLGVELPPCIPLVLETLEAHRAGAVSDAGLLWCLKSFPRPPPSEATKEATFLVVADRPELYTNSATDSLRRDSGLDIRFPSTHTIPPSASANGKPTIVSLGVRARCASGGKFLPYWLLPRSSFGKMPLEPAVFIEGRVPDTPLVLANVAGLIDEGYQGHLRVALRNLSAEPWEIKAGDALFQLVRPSLQPCPLELVSAEHSAFAESTARGEGGFGSTGVGGTGRTETVTPPAASSGGAVS